MAIHSSTENILLDLTMFIRNLIISYNAAHYHSIVTALHWMQRGLDDRKAVCPYVRPSGCPPVKYVHCDRRKAPSEKVSK